MYVKSKRRKNGWGGARPGAGRKKRYPRIHVDHVARPRFTELAAFHVTLRLRKGLPTLRAHETVRTIKALFAAAVDQGRLAPAVWSLQRNHIHMLVEAGTTAELSKGMHSLDLRIAKALNRLWGRKGPVFEERYFARPIEGPRDLRNTLRYVLLNHKRHGCRQSTVDWASSGPWFEFWAERGIVPPPGPRPVAAYRTDLLREGMSSGLAYISVAEQPRGRPSAASFLEA